MTAQAAKPKKKFEVPHILLIIAGIALFACLLTYVAPAGEFDLDASGNAIAGTYHAVERVPVSPLQALLWVKRGIENAASMISLMLIGGGSIGCIVASGAFDDILNFGVYKLQDKSTTVLVPAITALMGLLGAFAGAGVWQTLENGLGIIGAPVGIQRIVIGLIVTGAVLIDVVFRQGAGAKKKAKK